VCKRLNENDKQREGRVVLNERKREEKTKWYVQK
jgi:hypothetical protein